MVRSTSLIGLGAVFTATLTVFTMGTAHADLNPTGGDFVGIGSDTVQNIGNFLADGDNAGDTGYNATSPKSRLVSFDATPDANDRTGYAAPASCSPVSPSTSCTSPAIALNPTIVLRQGLQPVQRPNGSGSGIAALLLDTGATHVLDYVRMSRLPSTSEQSTADGAANVGPLRIIKISTDDLQIARSLGATVTPVGSTTPVTYPVSNAPANLTVAQLVDLYKCNTTNYNTIGGTSGTPVPLVPQVGSGTRSTFLADLKAANANVYVPLGSCVKTVEENDPSVIQNDPNAIAPFSAGRKALFDSGYFNDPSKKFGQAPTPLTSGVALNASTGTNYHNLRNLYIVFRNSAVNSATKFQPGGALNAVRDVFYNPGGGAPFVNTDAGIAAITAAGATASYADCGVTTTPNITTC